MSNSFEIVKEKVATTIIGGDGNMHCNTDNYQCFLIDENNEILSHQYECMLYLGYDHFAVCRIQNNVNYYIDGNTAIDRYNGIVQGSYEIANLKLKWGIIRVNRNEKGNIIPRSETMVLPYVYDRISENNLKTATAYSNGKLTYLDIDVESENYGQQLVPCILEHAVPFSVEYDGLAECSINGIVGFLPRNCKQKDHIDGNELLNDNQAKLVSKYLTKEGFVLDAETIYSYFNLTGIKLEKESGPILKKV